MTTCSALVCPRRSLRGPVAALALALAVTLAGRAHADEAPAAPAASDEALQGAKLHFETGKNAFNAGDYTTAIREFKAAEALRPSPILYYNIGLANEKLGKPRLALKYFNRYLAEKPDASNKDEVNQRIANAQAAIATQPATAAQAENPGDLPPPDNGTAPATTYGSADPYAGAAPPPAGSAPAAKKKSYWWVWLIVGGGALVVTSLIVAYVVIAGSTSTYSPYYEQPRGLLGSPRNPNGPPAEPGVLFRF